MTETIHFIEPSEGSHLAIKILEDINISRKIALNLYALVCDEEQARGVQSSDFLVNHVYKFGNGLEFRLFDGGMGEEDLALEFLAQVPDKTEKLSILSRIPSLLQKAEVKNEAALRNLRNILPSPLGRIAMG